MSKGRRNLLIAVFVLLAGGLIYVDHSPVRQLIQQKYRPKDHTQTEDCEKYHFKTFIVCYVVDGDTIDIDVPDGEFEHTRIRLWGVDTPETKNPKTGKMYFGQEAAEFTGKTTLGKEVTIYLDKDNNTRDKYGRLLAYIKLPDDGFLNEVLLSEGFAYADLRFKHNYYNKYKQLQACALRGKKGLWEKITREQLPEWLKRERPDLLIKQ